eukprot:CCRYP_010756-RA/>CCRYP_010756-RA protein AED:0.25 eAED:0.25 QI:0/0.66/0.75/1/0/0/4/1735/76
MATFNLLESLKKPSSFISITFTSVGLLRLPKLCVISLSFPTSRNAKGSSGQGHGNPFGGDLDGSAPPISAHFTAPL